MTLRIRRQVSKSPHNTLARTVLKRRTLLSFLPSFLALIQGHISIEYDDQELNRAARSVQMIDTSNSSSVLMRHGAVAEITRCKTAT